jgi:hypothetical protein
LQYKVIVMDDLDKALAEIGSIRRQLARNTEFRGYGPATLATTAVIALAAACVQTQWAPEAAHHLDRYLSIWLTTAAVSAALIGTQMITRAHRVHSGMADEMIRIAVEQFLPSLGAGVLLTIVLAWFVPGALWMLPGLWQICSGIGILSSCRFLPRPMQAAGAWYLLCGLLCISLGGERALSPWAMGISYGTGQLLVAWALRWKAREDADED